MLLEHIVRKIVVTLRHIVVETIAVIGEFVSASLEINHREYLFVQCLFAYCDGIQSVLLVGDGLHRTILFARLPCLQYCVHIAKDILPLFVRFNAAVSQFARCEHLCHSVFLGDATPLLKIIQINTDIILWLNHQHVVHRFQERPDWILSHIVAVAHTCDDEPQFSCVLLSIEVDESLFHPQSCAKRRMAMRQQQVVYLSDVILQRCHLRHECSHKKLPYLLIVFVLIRRLAGRQRLWSATNNLLPRSHVRQHGCAVFLPDVIFEVRCRGQVLLGHAVSKIEDVTGVPLRLSFPGGSGLKETSCSCSPVAHTYLHIRTQTKHNKWQ